MVVSGIANLIKVLVSRFVLLSDATPLEAYELAVENDVEIKDLT